MYQASAAFLNELKEDSRFEFIRGTIGGQNFSDDNIITMSYSNAASDTKDVSFGLAYVGILKCVLDDLEIPRGSYKGLQIAIEFGLEIPPATPGDPPTTEWIPAGVFFISEALWTDNGISITANDAMAKFDKAFNATQTSGSLYDFLTLSCTNCGVSLGMTRAEVEALPNGTGTFGLYPINDIKTFRDFIGWIAQTVGGFATIDRRGRLVVRSWASSTIVDTLTNDDRELASCSFSDYETAYAGISIVNIESKTTQYYGMGAGSVINLGSNPLLQYGTPESRDLQRQALATVAQGINWTPFQCSIVSNLIYDLGDLITMENAIRGTGTLTCCVMAIEWTIKQLTTLGGFGANPALSSAKSKTDKEISGLISSASENEMIIYTYMNAQAYELEDEVEESIINIRFATVSPKIVAIHHEIDLDITAIDDTLPVECEVHYYLNGVLESWKPKTSWNNDGMHLMHLLYYLSTLESGTRYEWEVCLVLKNGTATIGQENIHAILQGQGLVATDKWDGLVEVEDASYVFELGGDLLFNYDIQTITTATQTPNDDATIVDATYLFTLGGNLLFNYTAEDVDIEQNVRTSNLVTEDGLYNIVTEDGDYNIITEGEN